MEQGFISQLFKYLLMFSYLITRNVLLADNYFSQKNASNTTACLSTTRPNS